MTTTGEATQSTKEQPEEPAKLRYHLWWSGYKHSTILNDTTIEGALAIAKEMLLRGAIGTTIVIRIERDDHIDKTE